MVNVHAALYHRRRGILREEVTRVRRRVSVESADAGRLVRKSVVTLFFPLYPCPFFFLPFFLLFARAQREKKKEGKKED